MHHAGKDERKLPCQESLGRNDIRAAQEDGRWKLARMTEVVFVERGTNEIFA